MGLQLTGSVFEPFGFGLLICCMCVFGCVCLMCCVLVWFVWVCFYVGVFDLLFVGVCIL